MEFLSEIFIKFWKEVIVAVMLTAILPFIRAYVRRQRAKMMNFFKEKERLKQSLLEEEKKRKEAEEEIERLRAALEQEQQARQEAEQKYQAELQEKDEIRRKAASVYDTLMHEQKAHKELEQKYQAEAEEKRKAQEEVKSLRISLEQERNTRQEAERKRKEEIHEEAPKPVKKSYESLVQEIIDNHQDLNHIYDCLDIITTDYPDIIREKYSELFNRLYESRPHTIIPLFAHHGTRPFYTIDNSKLEDDISGVRYVNEGKKTKIFDTHITSGSFSTIYPIPDEIKERVNFLSMLYKFMRDTFGESDEVITSRCPYVKIVKRRVRNWSVIEPPSKKFMIFYRYYQEYKYSTYFGFAGTYTHHLLGRVENHGEYIPVFLPIIEGIDVTSDTGRLFGIIQDRDIRMAYIEAH